MEVFNDMLIDYEDDTTDDDQMRMRIDSESDSDSDSDDDEGSEENAQMNQPVNQQPQTDEKGPELDFVFSKYSWCCPLL